MPALDSIQSVRDSLWEVLRKRILVVDEQPILTRMFTFHSNVDCFLLLQFLGILPELFSTRGTQPRDCNRRCVAKVLRFFRLLIPVSI